MTKRKLTLSIILILSIFILGSCKSIHKSKDCNCPTFTEVEQVDNNTNA